MGIEAILCFSINSKAMSLSDKLLISEGKSPVSRLSQIHNHCKFVKFPISGPIVPVKLWPPISIDVRFTKLNMSEGKAPRIGIVRDMLMISSPVKLPKFEGIIIFNCNRIDR